MAAERLFVYGSLQRGFRHHELLAGARFVERASTVPGHRLVVVDGYPALTAGRGAVVGELFEVDTPLLERLDEFEDCPTLYQRIRVELAGGAGAWAYVMTAAAVVGCPEVAGGRWRE